MRSQKTFFSLAKRSFAFWFGGIWLLVGAPFLIIGVYSTWQTFDHERRLDREGHAVEGMVLTKHMRASSKNSSKRYFIRYRFMTREGQVTEGNAEVRAQAWDRSEERGPIQITYLPGRPEIRRIAGEVPAWMLGIIFSVLGLVFAPIGGFVFAKGLRSIWRALTILDTGMTAEATVVAVAPGSTQINGVPQWTVRYRYHDHRGKQHDGESDPMDPQEAQSWQVGDKGIIRFDFQSPRESVWMGKQ